MPRPVTSVSSLVCMPGDTIHALPVMSARAKVQAVAPWTPFGFLTGCLKAAKDTRDAGFGLRATAGTRAHPGPLGLFGPAVGNGPFRTGKGEAALVIHKPACELGPRCRS